MKFQLDSGFLIIKTRDIVSWLENEIRVCKKLCNWLLKKEAKLIFMTVQFLVQGVLFLPNFNTNCFYT